ncbi:MAG: 4-hydroxy-tetrahydrodipicolinate synthase [Lactobacillales bacterium]|jgi:4-hydroxy-tetrahydrodipicolinate synthase|nr:4-hydroxy-tetrahydrodipicolinate synthase [Lactobacillales bacterium]
MKTFSGLYTALVTPFDEKGEIDLDALKVLLDMQMAAGVQGLVVLGTTGESPTISFEERQTLFSFIKNYTKGKLELILGTGTNSTKHTIDLTKNAEDLGADGVLVVNPYYNKPSQDGLYAHFEAVARATALPVMLYNIMGRTGVNLETPVLIRLAKNNPNIVAIKEASGDIGQMMSVLAATPDNFAILSGDDMLTYPLMIMGGCGIVSVLSNIEPAKMQKMVCYLQQGEYKLARDIHFELLGKMKGAFIGGNPAAIKTALAQKGLIKPYFRLPLVAPTPEQQEMIKASFAN